MPYPPYRNDLPVLFALLPKFYRDSVLPGRKGQSILNVRGKTGSILFECQETTLKSIKGKGITMKISGLVVYLLAGALVEELSAQPSWRWLSPTPQGNVLAAVQAFDTNTVVAVGGASTIIRTTDGGNHWNVRHRVGGTPGYLLDMAFNDDGWGIAVGDYGKVLLTTDAGETWSTQSAGDHVASFCRCPCGRPDLAGGFLRREVVQIHQWRSDLEWHHAGRLFQLQRPSFRHIEYRACRWSIRENSHNERWRPDMAGQIREYDLCVAGSPLLHP